MANIAQDLAAIMAAVKGEEVRGSIHHAIWLINDVGEKLLGTGTAINAGDPAGDFYNASLYINTSTDELLRCNGVTWVSIGSIRGNGIDYISGPVTEDLDDTYTIHYTDGDTVDFTVHNGKGIVSVTCTSTVGLVDTYTILYNDGNSDTFEIKNGNAWYYGIAVSGTSSTTPATFVLPFAVREGDSYLNISNDSIYHCVAGAAAGGNSSWVFDFTITSTSTGTNNYNMLLNLPKINGVEVKGVQTGADLGLADASAVDSWLMDLTQTPPVRLSKPMPVDSTSVTFSAAELQQQVYANNYTVKAFFSVADGQPAPTLKKMIKDPITNAITISYSKVKAAQAGQSGTECNCILRIIK